MAAHKNLPFPDRPFALLLVEGGDERAVCKAVAEEVAWRDIHCWVAQGRDDLPSLASIATLDPNFAQARSVGIVMDVEESLADALALAARTLAPLGGVGTPVHAQLVAAPRPFGVFLTPDGTSRGSVETLCRQAALDSQLARCVDALLACAGTSQPRQARSDKGWLHAYLAMLPKPCRFHEAFAHRAIDPAHACFTSLRRFLAAL